MVTGQSWPVLHCTARPPHQHQLTDSGERPRWSLGVETPRPQTSVQSDLTLDWTGNIEMFWLLGLFIFPPRMSSHATLIIPLLFPGNSLINVRLPGLFSPNHTELFRICHQGTISLLRSAFITNISRFLLVGFDAPDCNNGGK